jgi:SET domain-containing protein
MQYPMETWLDPRLATGPSPIHGTGVFATAPIRAGELVMVWGGTAWSRAQLDAGEVPPCSFSFIDDDVLLAGPEDGLDYFVNHSCDPSVWMADEVTVVSRRDIASGDEITGDYALWESDDAYLVEACTCGAATCRGVVRGTDWQRPELQQRYAGHFLPYIERRFRQSD